MKRIVPLFLFVVSSILINPVSAQLTELQLDSTRLDVRVVASDLYIPWDLVFGPDGWIWFTERNGDVHRLQPETGELQLIHHVDEVFESDDNSGMYALALHPDFPVEPYVYVNYTYTLYDARLVRYTYDQQRNLLRDSVHIIPRFPANESHNGARIKFTADKKMMVALGDSYRADWSQDFDQLTGKILRLNPDGSIPADNPMPGSPIYSYGHRNPQGLAILPDGRIYESEHGVGSDDELNLIEPMKNYGWPGVQGFCDWASERSYCDSNDVGYPLMVWTPTWAPCGLEYYDHPAIPEWSEALLQVFLKSGDGFYGQRMQVIHLNEAGDSVTAVQDVFKSTFGRLRDVLVAPDGRVFVCTSNQERNGNQVVQAEDDRIIELRNPLFPLYEPQQHAYLPASLNVHPNPARDVVVVQFPVVEGEVTLRLLDLAGRELRHESLNLNGFSYLLERNGLQTGLYILEAEMPDGTRQLARIQFL